MSTLPNLADLSRLGWALGVEGPASAGRAGQSGAREGEPSARVLSGGHVSSVRDTVHGDGSPSSKVGGT